MYPIDVTLAPIVTDVNEVLASNGPELPSAMPGIDVIERDTPPMDIVAGITALVIFRKLFTGTALLSPIF